MNELTYPDGQGRLRYSPRVTHLYAHRGPHSHDYQVCQVVPCPLRAAAGRLRHHFRVKTTASGVTIDTNADHVDLAEALDEGEDFWCFTHGEPVIGTRVAKRLTAM